MPRLDLLTAGEAFDDLIFSGLARLPEPGEEVKTDRLDRAPGGGAVITAIAAGRLGLRVGVASALGETTASALRVERIKANDLRRGGERPALTVAISTRHERSFVTFNGVNARLEPRLMRAVSDGSWRHLHLALHPTRCAAWARIVARLRREGVSTSWDFGWNPSLRADPDLPSLLAALDLVFLNEPEARLYSRARTEAGAIAWWRRRGHATVIKRGRHGAIWLDADRTVRAPATRVRAVETTGAGDAFNAGVLAGLLHGAAPEACLRLGNAVGALSTRAPGGVEGLPSRTEGRRLVDRLVGRQSTSAGGGRRRRV